MLGDKAESRHEDEFLLEVPHLGAHQVETVFLGLFRQTGNECSLLILVQQLREDSESALSLIRIAKLVSKRRDRVKPVVRARAVVGSTPPSRNALLLRSANLRCELQFDNSGVSLSEFLLQLCCVSTCLLRLLPGIADRDLQVLGLDQQFVARSASGFELVQPWVAHLGLAAWRPRRTPRRFGRGRPLVRRPPKRHVGCGWKRWVLVCDLSTVNEVGTSIFALKFETAAVYANLRELCYSRRERPELGVETLRRLKSDASYLSEFLSQIDISNDPRRTSRHRAHDGVMHVHP